MTYNVVKERAMNSEERSKLRMEIRTLLAKAELRIGLQQKWAETYSVSRQYINSIVRDERKRLQNPAAWELEKANKRKKPLNILKLLEDLKAHPVFRQNRDPEN